MFRTLAARAPFVPPIVPAAPTIVYTVPAPLDQAQGVGRDGRLHLVGLDLQPVVVGNMSTICLEYLASDGSRLARWVDGWTDCSMAGLTDYSTSWGGEPGGVPFDVVGNAWRAQSQNFGPFHWLQAGMQVGISQVDTGQAWRVQSIRIVVEDFSQLGQGQEFQTGAAHSEAPVFLLAGDPD